MNSKITGYMICIGYLAIASFIIIKTAIAFYMGPLPYSNMEIGEDAARFLMAVLGCMVTTLPLSAYGYPIYFYTLGGGNRGQKMSTDALGWCFIWGIIGIIWLCIGFANAG